MDLHNDEQKPRELAEIVNDVIMGTPNQTKISVGTTIQGKTFAAFMVGTALMLAGWGTYANYKGNQAEYDSRLTQAIQMHVMPRMPANPMAAYLQSDDYQQRGVLNE